MVEDKDETEHKVKLLTLYCEDNLKMSDNCKAFKHDGLHQSVKHESRTFFSPSLSFLTHRHHYLLVNQEERTT